MKKKKNNQKLKPNKVQSKAPSFFYRNIVFILLGVILLITAFIRLRLLNIPLERDEGEYAYFGQLMLAGIPPFEAAYTMKFPGTHFMYAFFMLIFGQSVAGIHFGLLIINLVTSLFLFFIVKRLIGNSGALVAALVFSLLSLNDTILGFAGHATHFVTFAAVTGILLLLKAFDNNKLYLYFISGIFFGLAPVFKQSGIFFSAFGGLILITHGIIENRRNFKQFLKNLGIFVSGGLFPIILVLFMLYISGVFDSFLFWTIEYPFAYGGQVPFYRGMKYLSNSLVSVMDGFTVLWVFAAIGIPLLFFNASIRKNTFTVIFVILFLIFSFLTIVPGLYFRPHYFICLLPAVGIFAGIAVGSIANLKIKGKNSMALQTLSVLIIMVIVGIGINNNAEYFFKEKSKDISRRIYGLNPFVESEAIGGFIKRNTNEDDKILVLGSEPQVYFHADRVSATGFIYMYPMMEDHEYNLPMQAQMIAEVEEADPDVVVIVDVNKSWLRRPKSPSKIFSWYLNKYSEDKYKMIGSVEIFSNATLYKFTPIALKNQQVSKYRIRILKKKG